MTNCRQYSLSLISTFDGDKFDAVDALSCFVLFSLNNSADMTDRRMPTKRRLVLPHFGTMRTTTMALTNTTDAILVRISAFQSNCQRRIERLQSFRIFCIVSVANNRNFGEEKQRKLTYSTTASGQNRCPVSGLASSCFCLHSDGSKQCCTLATGDALRSICTHVGLGK